MERQELGGKRILMSRKKLLGPLSPIRAGIKLKQGRHQGTKSEALTLTVVQTQGRSWCSGTDHEVSQLQ